MASEQVQNKEKPQPEEPRVLKMAHHFEVLAKDSDKAKTSGEEGKDQKGDHSHTLEDISKYRAQAQQNSMEAIRGAEERYAKAKEEALSGQKEATTVEKGGGADVTAANKGGQEGYGAKAKEEALSGKKEGTAVEKGGGGGAELPTTTEGGAAKETIVNVGKTVIDYTKNAAEQAKDKGGIAVHYVSEKARNAAGNAGEERGGAAAAKESSNEAGYAGEEGGGASKETGGAKVTGVNVGKTVIDYTKHAAEQAKDVVVTTTGTAVHYVGEKAVAAKDTSIGVGKSAAGYAGEKAVAAKDVALETGLRAAHYTLQKAVEVTEATAGVGRRAAEATAEKAEATEEKLGKEQEVEHDMKMRKEVEEKKEEEPEKMMQSGESKPGEGTGGSLLGAVKETLVEIAETGKGMVIGEETDKK